MGKIKVLSLLIGVILLLSPLSVYAEIEVEGVKLMSTDLTTAKTPLTNSTIMLAGPEKEQTFYYEIKSKPQTDNNKLVFNIKYSELLITPSSVTLSVDDEPILSKEIGGKKEKEQIELVLKGKMLEEGFHAVKLSFYGVVKEGVCVEQETSGNWLSIGIESYIQLSDQKQQLLTDYPSQFIGVENQSSTLIIPDNPSLATLDSGVKLAAYLAEKSSTEDAIQVVRESEVEVIDGNIIVIGATSEFQTDFMRNLLTKVKIPEAQDALFLSRHLLTDENQQVQSLFVLAHSPQEIEKRIDILTTDSLIKQLSGQQMIIETIPEGSSNPIQQTIHMKEFGMPNITLDHFETTSEQFFYRAPTIQSDGTANLELHLKKSETITSLMKNDRQEIPEDDVELTVLVNETPYSVDMRRLSESENDYYTVRIPIEGKVFNQNNLIQLQFISTGLKKKNPCLATDQNRWIYIANDSFLTLPKGEAKKPLTLANFPSPFIESENETFIIVPDMKKEWDTQLVYLSQSMQMMQGTSKWKLSLAKDLVAEDLEGKHLIFLGGPDAHPLLKEKESSLLIDYEKGIPNLSKLGFLQEAVDQFSWLQASLWDPQKAMLVLDRTGESVPYIDDEFSRFLKRTEEQATIAVKLNQQEIYTNADQLEANENRKNMKVDEELKIPTGAMISFIGLLLFTILLIFIVLRKQKKKELE